MSDRYRLQALHDLRTRARAEKAAALANELDLLRQGRRALEGALERARERIGVEAERGHGRREHTSAQALVGAARYRQRLDRERAGHLADVAFARRQLASREAAAERARAGFAAAQRARDAIARHRERWRRDQSDARLRCADDDSDEAALARFSNRYNHLK